MPALRPDPRPVLAYLGPAGTFAEAAAHATPDAPRYDLLPTATVPAALDAVRAGAADGAVVPMENSIEGSVNATLDELASGAPLVITAEVVLPVRFALLARAGTRLEDVRAVATHPHAEAQCRGWLATNLPHVAVIPASSTASAAAVVAQPDAPYDAAISARIAAAHYGLAVLADGIGDSEDTHTRFVRVARPGSPPTPTGADKTSLIAYMREDHPGALLEILEEFSVRGINLTRIESRPTGARLGNYCFSIDCEGHLLDARVGEALMGLRRVCADVRFLGSYARADRRPPQARYGTSDDDFRAAADWLARLRGAAIA